jgi:hypothetical protein
VCAEAGEANLSFPLRPGSAAPVFLVIPFLGEKTFDGGKKKIIIIIIIIVPESSGPNFSAAPPSP